MVQEVCIVSDPVMLHIWACLHNYAYDDAIFAAERLFAETQSSESLHLLATSLYRVGRPKQVSRLLTSMESISPKCRYLLSKCHFDFGLLNEAEEALIGHSLSSRPIDEVIEIYGEQAAYAMLLLGDIRRRQGRTNDASTFYKKSLELNPMLWTAFKNLCDMGDFPNPSTIFQLHEGLRLPTPTYKCVCTFSSTDALSENPSMKPDECVELGEICSRENVNPEQAVNPLDSMPTLKHFAAPGYTSERTFLTHVNNAELTNLSLSNFLSESAEPPKEKCAASVVSNTPKSECILNLSKVMLPDQRSGMSPSTIALPHFGALSLLTQSSMFACVPVFHKQRVCPATMDSFLAGSSSFGSQTLPLRNSALNESITKRSLRNSPTVRRSSRLGDHAGPRIQVENVCANLRDTGIVNIRPSTDRTITSTPACTASSLRRLVISESPNPGPVSSHTPLPTSNVVNGGLSSSRYNPPVLRSNTQRAASLGNCALACTDIQAPNPHSSAIVSYSCTQRDFLVAQSVSRMPTIDASAFEDCQTIGPRTRSQVAAAALARASVVQRGSSRPGRSKLSSQKTETVQVGRIPSKSDGGSAAEPNDLVQGTFNARNPTFGDDPYSHEFISMELPATNDGDPRVSSLINYLNLLSELGRAYKLLIQHNWKSATRLLAMLPSTQISTGCILSWAARAHMDNADYATARKLFIELRRREPWQLFGMDFYSTVLWQLQADHELSVLAHELLQLDRNAPEPWCAASNCFSLQGEHELAIRFLQRAIQVCPTSAYAFTLLGHEQSIMEDFDHALNSFRHALRLDPRQYNALFGMGNVYYKQERFELADIHLSRAVALFPQSHLLLTNLGALRGRLGHLDDGPNSALALLTRACKIQPTNPLARYHRSSILFHLGRYAEVLVELQKLLVLTPREAMVYLMIGHTYKKLGNTPQAMIHYSWAMGLDPKGANTHLRDIMTNPPVAGRSATRYVGISDTTEIENGTASGLNARSRLASVPNEGGSVDTPLNSDANEPDFLNGEPTNTMDETTGGFLNSSQFLGSIQTRGSTRRLNDLSMLFGSELFEDGGLSSVGDQETMDLSGETSHSPVDN